MRLRKKTYEEQEREISEIMMRFISSRPEIEETGRDYIDADNIRKAAEDEWFKDRAVLKKAWFNEFGSNCIIAGEITVTEDSTKTTVSLAGRGAELKKEWLIGQMASMGYINKEIKMRRR